jgi:Zn-dependent protease
MEQDKSRIIKWLFMGGIFLSKIGKFSKVFAVAKPITMFLSMAISAIAYAFWLGPWFSIGLVLLLMIHEMGHVAAMRMKGYETATPVFIPFIGAAIFAPNFKSREDEAFIGIAGPVLGSIGALVVFLVWHFVPDKDSALAHVLITLAFTGVFLNLFNLIPISPLDGGRVTQAVGEWFKYIGLVMIVGIIVLTGDPVLMILMIGVIQDFQSISLLKRAVVSVLLWVTMFTMVVLDIGDQSAPWWIEAVYVIFGGLIAAVSVAAYKDRDTNEESEKVEPLAPLNRRDRICWFASYLTLSLGLIVVLTIQSQFLPTPQ